MHFQFTVLSVGYSSKCTLKKNLTAYIYSCGMVMTFILRWGNSVSSEESL